MLKCKMILLAFVIIPAAAQDAALVSPKIVKVEFENDKVRILRALYRPDDRLKMHSHPYGINVCGRWMQCIPRIHMSTIDRPVRPWTRSAKVISVILSSRVAHDNE